MKRFFVFISLLLVTPHADSMSWFNHFRAANAYQNGDLQTAQQLLDDAVTASTTDFQAAYNRGKVAYAQKDFEKAEAYFEKATQVQDNDQLKVQAWFDTGNAQVQQKKFEPALLSYQEVVKLAPGHEQAKDMIKQLKKILEQQKQQQQKDKNKNDKNDQQKNQQNNNDDQKGDQENSDDQNKNQQQNKNNQDDQQDSGQKEQNDNKGDDQERKQQDLENERDKKNQEQEGAENDHGQSHGQDRQQPQDKPENQQKQNKGEKPEQHDTPSEKSEQPSTKDGTKNKEKTQGSGEPENQEGPTDDQKPDEYTKLFAALDQRDSQISKDLLKANLKETMPQKHGQKNW